MPYQNVFRTDKFDRVREGNVHLWPKDLIFFTATIPSAAQPFLIGFVKIESD